MARAGRVLAWPVVAAIVLAAPAARAESSPLIEAARAGEHSAAIALIEDGAAVDTSEADGTTALHWAAHARDAGLVRALLEAGADPNAGNRYGMTALHVAADGGDSASVEALLEFGADARARTVEGEPVIMTAARTGSAAAIEALIAHGADVEARESWYGETALMWAAAGNHADAVQALAAHGADVDAVSAAMDYPSRRSVQTIMPLGQWPALFYAARENALEAGAALLAAGADPDIQDPDGATALVIAIINAQHEFAELLVESGADPNIGDFEAGMAPLYAAVDMNSLAVGHGRGNPITHGPIDAVHVARVLLAAGADPNAQLKKPIMQRQHTIGDSQLGEGATALLRAAKSGDIDMLRVLLEGGADPHATMPNGTTALIFAAGLGWRDGSPMAPSFDQGTEEAAVETIATLLELGLDIEAANDSGVNALHAAISGRGSALIVEYLLERGADPLAVNGRGQTALELAESRGTQEIAALVRARAPGRALPSVE